MSSITPDKVTFKPEISQDIDIEIVESSLSTFSVFSNITTKANELGKHVFENCEDIDFLADLENEEIDKVTNSLENQGVGVKQEGKISLQIKTEEKTEGIKAFEEGTNIEEEGLGEKAESTENAMTIAGESSYFEGKSQDVQEQFQIEADEEDKIRDMLNRTSDLKSEILQKHGEIIQRAEVNAFETLIAEKNAIRLGLRQFRNAAIDGTLRLKLDERGKIRGMAPVIKNLRKGEEARRLGHLLQLDARGRIQVPKATTIPLSQIKAYVEALIPEGEEKPIVDYMSEEQEIEFEKTWQSHFAPLLLPVKMAKQEKKGKEEGHVILEKSDAKKASSPDAPLKPVIEAKLRNQAQRAKTSLSISNVGENRRKLKRKIEKETLQQDILEGEIEQGLIKSNRVKQNVLNDQNLKYTADKRISQDHIIRKFNLPKASRAA